jgi:hypothetical protein
MRSFIMKDFIVIEGLERLEVLEVRGKFPLLDKEGLGVVGPF